MIGNNMELWETLFLNPVWPSELIENAKDPDYKSINIKPLAEGQEITLSFIDEGELVTAVYIFDEKDYLQHSYFIEHGVETIIYNRQQMVSDMKSKIRDGHNSKVLA